MEVCIAKQPTIEYAFGDFYQDGGSGNAYEHIKAGLKRYLNVFLTMTSLINSTVDNLRDEQVEILEDYRETIQPMVWSMNYDLCQNPNNAKAILQATFNEGLMEYLAEADLYIEVLDCIPQSNGTVSATFMLDGTEIKAECGIWNKNKYVRFIDVDGSSEVTLTDGTWEIYNHSARVFMEPLATVEVADGNHVPGHVSIP